MVRRKQPQPSASSPARPSSKAKDYTTHREYQVQDELDELRTRGVAKFMNRHFTETSKQLAKDKAEADAALADLERRRAQTSEFVPSTSGELHPFDSLYVELQQKRADCRRKERETMLLYQRYVHKFQKNKAPSAPSKAPEKKATPPVQEVDEEIDDDEPEYVQQTPEKGDINVSIDDTSTPEAAAPPPSSPPAPPVEVPPGASPSHEQEVLESVEEKKTPDLPDLKSTPLPVPEDKSVEPQKTESQDKPVEQEVATEKEPEPQQQQQEPQESSTPAIDTSMEKIDCNNAVEAAQSSPEPVDTPALVEKAPEEEETAATPVTPVPNSPSSESFSVNRPTAEVRAEFAAATTSEEESDEDDQRSVISGLTTVNSALTRQVMEQLESEMEFFIKNETEAIQKLLDEEEEGVASVTASSRLSSEPSVACDKSIRASLKAEQMAEEMQKMLEQFEKEEMSSSEEPTPTADETKIEPASITQSLYPRKYKSPNPNEDWMVYWDEKYEREYFYEKKSKTTQWDPPVMKLGFKDNPDFVPQEMPKRTSKLIVEKRLSRSDIYKKKLRKQRMRRAAFLFVILASLLLSAVHWKINHAEKSYPDAMKATYIDLKDVYEYSFTNRTAEEQEAAEIARRKEEKARKSREAAELERKRKEAEAKAEAERLRLEQKRAQEEAERKRKAAEEAEKKRKLEAEKKAARERRLREEEEARLRAEEEARQRKKEEERLKKQEEERKAEEARLEAERLAKLEEELRRPWGCNLPFSHVVHRRCRKLAKINPIYGEEHLLNSFLQ